MKKYIGILVLFGLFMVPALSFAQEQGDVNPNPVSSCVSITHNLQYRSRDINTGGDVSTLQDFLQSQGYLNTEPTGYFGLLTQTAVKQFQSAQNILNSGYVGSITRAKISDVSCNGTTSIPNNPTVTSPIPPTTSTPTTDGCVPGQNYSTTTGQPCASSVTPILINNPVANLKVSFPLAISGVINSNSWSVFEGQAGKAQIYYESNNNWSPIGSSVSIPVSDWTTPGQKSFSITVNFNNDGIGLPDGTPMKVTFTDENASGLGSAHTFDLPLILDLTGCSSGQVYSSTTGQPCSTTSTTPSITVLSPNGGETLQTGQTYNITWTSTGVDNVYIWLSGKGASDVAELIGEKIPASLGKYSWVIPNSIIDNGNSSQFKIAISQEAPNPNNINDFSDNYFTITSSTTFPPGCTSSQGYSRTTGQPCSTTVSTSHTHGSQAWNYGWSDFTSGGSVDHSAQILADYQANPTTYGYDPINYSGASSAIGKYVLRLYKSCSDNWIDRKEKIPLDNYSNYTGSNRYQEQCINDGSFDSYYDEAILSGSTTIPTPSAIPVISGVSGPQSLNVNQTGTWTVNASSPDYESLTYMVIWGDEGPAAGEGTGISAAQLQERTQQSATFTHSYSPAGVYTPTFYVSNSSGLGQTAQTSLSVNVGSSTTTSSVNVNLNPAFVNTTYVRGITNVKIGSYILSNTPNENARVSSFSITMNGNARSFQNLQAKINSTQYGQTYGTLNPGSSYTFTTNGFVIPAGTSVVVDLYADVLTNASVGGGPISATSWVSCSGTGAQTNNAISCNGNLNGQMITIISTIPPTCEYAAPQQGCSYIQGPNYNPTTGCGRVLSCVAPTPTSTVPKG